MLDIQRHVLEELSSCANMNGGAHLAKHGLKQAALLACTLKDALFPAELLQRQQQVHLMRSTKNFEVGSHPPIAAFLTLCLRCDQKRLSGLQAFF